MREKVFLILKDLKSISAMLEEKRTADASDGSAGDLLSILPNTAISFFSSGMSATISYFTVTHLFITIVDSEN